MKMQIKFPNQLSIATCILGMLLASVMFVGNAAAQNDSRGIPFGSSSCGQPAPCAQWKAYLKEKPNDLVQLQNSCVAQRLGFDASPGQFDGNKPDSSGCMTGKGKKASSGYIMRPTCCVAEIPSQAGTCYVRCDVYARPN